MERFFMEAHTGSVDTYEGWMETLEELKRAGEIHSVEEEFGTLYQVEKLADGSWEEVR